MIQYSVVAGDMKNLDGLFAEVLPTLPGGVISDSGQGKPVYELQKKPRNIGVPLDYRFLFFSRAGDYERCKQFRNGGSLSILKLYTLSFPYRA